MKILYLDDSGKVHPNDPARFVVFGGFSVDEGRWHSLVRQLNGVKYRFFPQRSKPYEWEVKSTDFLTSNDWKRAKRRNLCFEVANALERNNARVYVVSMDKSKAIGSLAEARFIPLMFQRLVAKFHSEIVNEANTGSIVCDWSTYQMDHHVSNCVTSMVIVNKLELVRGGVTYGSSASLVPLQVADLIAGAFRRYLEGQNHLQSLQQRLVELRYVRPGETDFQGYPVDSIVNLF